MKRTDQVRRAMKARAAVRHLIRTGHIGGGRRTGAISRLAEHFGVSRQRISQIAHEFAEFAP